MVNLDEAEVLPRAANFVIEDGKVHLRASRCPSCGAALYPSREICPADGTDSLEDILLSSSGTVYTFTVARQSTPEFRTPYVLVYVDFPENVRVLLPYDGSEPPVIGAKVEIVMADGPPGWKMMSLFQCLMPNRDLNQRWPFYEWEFGSLSTLEAVSAGSACRSGGQVVRWEVALSQARAA